MALRLEPFTDDQVDRWLKTWNTENGVYFKDNELQPLTTHVALAYRHLAEQPLLLLMLALYDADGGGLQNMESELGTAKLYERLLERFARREIEKHMTGLSAEQMNEEVRRELLRLSVVAFAMNPKRQWAKRRSWIMTSPLFWIMGPYHQQLSCAPHSRSSSGRPIFLYAQSQGHD